MRRWNATILDNYAYNGDPSKRANQYEGYIVDLLDRLAKIVGFKYELIPVHGFGFEQQDGTWDGMIGELRKQVK